MKFNTKNLLLPISISISISGSCINATEQNINPINNMVEQNINANNNLVNENGNVNNNIDAIDSMIGTYRNKYNTIQRIRNKFVQKQILSHLSKQEQLKIQSYGGIKSKYVLRQIFSYVNG